MPLSTLAPGSLLLLETPPLDVWGQMALDEWLLDLDEPSLCLRFHRWAGGPAASFGYSRPIAEIQSSLPPHLRAHCTRRLTGGGLSRHGGDVGFSCVFPYPSPTWNPLAVRRVLNEAVGRGFQNLDLEVCLVARPLPPPARPRVAKNPFFRQAIDLELTALDDSRILHVAMCHRRDRVLCQCIVVMPDARGLEPQIHAAVRSGFEMAVHTQASTPLDWSPDARFAALREKYHSPEWVYRR